jgi:hypothetical protein
MAALDRIARERGHRPATVCENGWEFRSESMDQWADQLGITPAYTEPGRPIPNASIKASTAACGTSA